MIVLVLLFLTGSKCINKSY